MRFNKNVQLTFETATIQDNAYKHPLVGMIMWVLVTVRLLSQQTAGMILTPRISQKAAGADILRIRRAPSRRSHPRLVFILLTGNSFWRLRRWKCDAPSFAVILFFRKGGSLSKGNVMKSCWVLLLVMKRKNSQLNLVSWYLFVGGHT
jgi:hypothetical protein